MGIRAIPLFPHHLRNVIAVVPQLAGAKKLVKLVAEPAARESRETRRFKLTHRLSASAHVSHV